MWGCNELGFFFNDGEDILPPETIAEYLNTLEAEVETWKTRAAEEAKRGLENGKARLAAEHERDRLLGRVERLQGVAKMLGITIREQRLALRRAALQNGSQES